MTRRIGGLAAVAALIIMGADVGRDAMFTSLFDGKTLNGWSAEHTDRFSVRDGAIFGDGGVGWLRWGKPYADFEFEAEYRAIQKGSDSGIFFRASQESGTQDTFWPARGYQLQVADGDNNLMILGHGTPPPTFDRKADVLKGSMKGVGEWQTIVLKVVGKRAEVVLNGKLITVTEAITLKDGFLGLQGENGQFEWRNLKLKELPATQ
ncbi:3-keto-disaccharide hydrolase [Singulisphaera sp. PoT]|uniref:3-keto-disaccharide hydrolase n=1 Tax=Singulisphaera sp. PoT TaxID=3411797 RepID=UPI003BF5D68E